MDLPVEQTKKDFTGNSFVWDHKSPNHYNSKEKTSTLVGCGLSKKKIVRNIDMSGRRGSADHFNFAYILRLVCKSQVQQKNFTSCVHKRHFMLMILLNPKQLISIKSTILRYNS